MVAGRSGLRGIDVRQTIAWKESSQGRELAIARCRRMAEKNALEQQGSHGHARLPIASVSNAPVFRASLYL